MNQIIGIAVIIGLTFFTILLCTAIEQIAPIERFSLKARIPGALMNAVGIIGSVAVIWPFQHLWAMIAHGPVVVVPLWRWLGPLGAAGFALQVLVLVLVADFLAYWRHRAEHRWFWPIHMVHHAPHDLHAANNIGHPIQVLFTVLFVSVPMSLIQIDGPGTPVVVGFLITLSTYYIHSPIDVHFGRMRRLLVDNRFHRIHHSLELRHHDRNFGICFSIWDRMFGTAYDPRPDEWPAVGVAGVAPPRTVREFLMLPVADWRRPVARP